MRPNEATTNDGRGGLAEGNAGFGVKGQAP